MLAELLTFSWPSGGGEFTFDLGGTFRGDGLSGSSFLAEVKNYKREGDLPAHFRSFLAKAYVALGDKPKRCDHFLWISWAPFQAQKWDAHATVENVKKAILHKDHCSRIFGTDDVIQADAAVDSERMTRVADKVWLVTLGLQQEQLVLSEQHYLEVRRLIIAEGIAS